MKKIHACSLSTIISSIIIFVPPIVIITVGILQSIPTVAVIILALIYLIVFFLLFSPSFGVIKFLENCMVVSGDLTLKWITKIQYKSSVDLNKVSSIEFVENSTTSIGSKIPYRNTGIPPYIKLNMEDGTHKLVYLGKFSKKQWIEIQENILICNKQVLLINDVNTFITYRKTGVR